MISLLIVLSCHKPVSLEPTINNGKIGVQYRRVDDWMLVTRVIPGMPAEAAGIKPGFRLLAADDKPAFEGQKNNVAGPAGMVVSLTVLPPLAQSRQKIDVKRVAQSPKNIKQRGRQRLHEFLSLPKSEHGLWFSEIERNLAGTLSVDSFWRLLLQDPELNSWSTKELRDLIAHVPNPEILNFFQELFPELNTIQGRGIGMMSLPNTWDPNGEPLRTGGWPMLEWRSFLNDWVKQTVDRAKVSASVRQLAQAYELSTDHLSHFGMAPYPKEQVWSAPTPPMRLPDMALLNGDEWGWRTDHSLTVINFWATWCGPCRREMPELVSLSEAYAESKVRFLALSTDVTTERVKVEAMLEEWNVPFATAHEPSFGRHFQVTGIPAIRILNHRGQLVYSQQGYSDSAIEELGGIIDKQLIESRPIEEVYAYTLGSKKIKLQRFIGINNLQAVTVHNEEIWASVSNQGPTELMQGLSKPGPVLSGYHPGQMMTYCRGPVLADKGGHLLRGYSEDGRPTWTQTTPTPIIELHSVNDLLYVLTIDSVLVLDHQGTLIKSHLGDWLDITATTNSVLGLVDGNRVVITEHDLALPVPAPVGSSQVNAQGGYTSSLYSQPMMIKNNESLLPLYYRPDIGRIPATVVWEESTGILEYLFLTGTDHNIGLWNNEDDENESLVVSFPNVGVAIFQLDYDEE